ncbi:RNA 2',3'-cyclic phosphodiesterase [bacterium]|nr:MAG: RNA 2',3'-cyclic phosphodiesterase [bacterium]
MPDDSANNIRAFVAIELPENVIKMLSDTQHGLKSEGLSGIGFVRPENIHLTLKFLGDVDKGRLTAIKEALEKATESVKVFTVTVEGLGAFPSLKNPRVLWVGVNENAMLSQLQDRLEKALFDVGFEKEGRPFKPHLTLARFKTGTDARHCGKAVEALGQSQKQTFSAGSLVLFESRLSAKGAEYKALEKVSFFN